MQKKKLTAKICTQICIPMDLIIGDDETVAVCVYEN